MPKMVTHVASILYREEEKLKIHPIRERSELYLEVPMKSGIADMHETNTLEKQKLHLMLWCKPQIVAL